MTKPLQNHAQKLSKFVKQNSAEGSVGAENTLKKQWQRRDLNPRPKAYESSALPLSYAAMLHVLSYFAIFYAAKQRLSSSGKAGLHPY